jgi:hypothetical protein
MISLYKILISLVTRMVYTTHRTSYLMLCHLTLRCYDMTEKHLRLHKIYLLACCYYMEEFTSADKSYKMHAFTNTFFIILCYSVICHHNTTVLHGYIYIYIYIVKPALNGPFTKRNFS